MNNEIKEILDKLKDGGWYDELDLTGEMWIELRWKETHLLLDYITNLQQEIKEANDSITWWTNRFKAVERDNRELKQENERLKETNVYCNRTDCVGRIKDSRKYDSVYQEKEDYKSRCEKASEYFKYQLENLDFYEDTKARMLCAMGITLLQNGSENNE